MSTLSKAITELNDYRETFVNCNVNNLDVNGADHFLFCGDIVIGKTYEALKLSGIRHIYLCMFNRYSENKPPPIHLYLVEENLSTGVYRARKSNVPIPENLYSFLQQCHPDYKGYNRMNHNTVSNTFEIKVFLNKQSNIPITPTLRLQRYKELLHARKLPLAGSMSRPENAHILTESQTDFIVNDINVETATATITWLNPDININPDNLRLAISFMNDGIDVIELNYGYIQSAIDACVVSHEVAPVKYSKQSFDFPVAMRAVLDGRAVRRTSWKDTLKFISYTEAQSIDGSQLWSKYNKAAANGATVTVAGNITMNSKNTILPYNMTGEDLLATDWTICEWVERRYVMSNNDNLKANPTSIETDG